MKIAAWNLNHRTFKKPIPETVSIVLRSLAPDVVVLTEYVEGEGLEDRAALRRGLEGMGLVHVSVSKPLKGHNQVLVASRLRHAESNLSTYDDSHAKTNFLPVRFPDLDMTLVGMRAPAYESSKQVDDYWKSVVGNVSAASHTKLILVGDLNAEPGSPRSIGGKHLCALLAQGWKIPTAPEPWSYISSDGKHTSKVDHLVASPAIGAATASYITKRGDFTVAGLKAKNPISDHAILLCEVEVER